MEEEGKEDGMFQRKVTRRQAISTSAKIGAAVVATAVVAGGAGYLGGVSSTPTGVTPAAQTITQTQTQSVTGTQKEWEDFTLVSWGGAYIEQMDPLIKKFEADHNNIKISVELHTGAASAVIGRIKSDLPRITRTVIGSWDPSAAGMDREKWSVILTPDIIPVMEEYPQAAFIHNSQGFVTGIGWQSYELAYVYRTDLVPKDLQPLDSFDKLLDPRLKGKILTLPVSGGAGAAVWLPAYAKGGSEFDMEPGWKFMEELAKSGNIEGVTAADAEILAALTSGTVWIALGAVDTGVVASKNGVPIDRMRQPKSTSVAKLGFQVLKNSPGESTGLEWMNWFFQKDQNERYNMGIGAYPTHPKARSDPDLKKYFLDLSSAEGKAAAVTPDYDYAQTQLDSWQVMWEDRIQPLL